jgi:hypothetical protein
MPIKKQQSILLFQEGGELLGWASLDPGRELILKSLEPPDWWVSTGRMRAWS